MAHAVSPERRPLELRPLSHIGGPDVTTRDLATSRGAVDLGTVLLCARNCPLADLPHTLPLSATSTASVCSMLTLRF